MKLGGISLSAIGYIQVYAYTSNARIPIEDAAVAVTDNQNRLLALRLTDESGKIVPIALSVPDFSTSQEPEGAIAPFGSVNLSAHAEDYEDILVRDMQVFADTLTQQDLQFVPLPELPSSWDLVQQYTTTPQYL